MQHRVQQQQSNMLGKLSAKSQAGDTFYALPQQVLVAFQEISLPRQGSNVMGHQQPSDLPWRALLIDCCVPVCMKCSPHKHQQRSPHA